MLRRGQNSQGRVAVSRVQSSRWRRSKRGGQDQRCGVNPRPGPSHSQLGDAPVLDAARPVGPMHGADAPQDGGPERGVHQHEKAHRADGAGGRRQLDDGDWAAREWKDYARRGHHFPASPESPRALSRGATQRLHPHRRQASFERDLAAAGQRNGGRGRLDGQGTSSAFEILFSLTSDCFANHPRPTTPTRWPPCWRSCPTQKRS
jgi:hypothetical protein